MLLDSVRFYKNLPKGRQKIRVMQKGTLRLIGFTLLMVGGVSLVLSLVGARLTFLVWLDKINPLFGFVMKIVMIVAGIIIASLSNTNWTQENEE